MSWQIQITKAKPNPAGKDKTKWTPKPEQLLGEWADLKNVGDANVSLSAIHLAHREFAAGCVLKDAPVIYWNGPNTVLKVGETVRVHTGRSGDSWAMAAVDKSGVEHHAYAEKGSFVLNNDCGDGLSVWWKDQDGSGTPTTLPLTTQIRPRAQSSTVLAASCSLVRFTQLHAADRRQAKACQGPRISSPRASPGSAHCRHTRKSD